jgi:Flp pilus assembly protein TadG
VSVLTEAPLVREGFARDCLMPYYRAMRMTARERLRKRRGQTLPIMAALLIPALGVWALTMDLGLVYVRRAEMQRTADAAVLAGAQEFITGGSVETYVTTYLEKNPVGDTVATIEQLVINSDSGRVDLTIGYQTQPLLLAPNGVGLRVRSGATAELTDSGEVGKPVPPGNAYGWYKNEKKSSPGKDSALVRLTS